MPNKTPRNQLLYLQRLQHLPQLLLPHHGLSRLVGKLAESRIVFLKNALIKLFIWIYQVNMSEAIQPEPESYESFNDFFTRALKPEARPVTSLPLGIACPADGTLSQFGNINNERLIQAKGKDFSLINLLGNDQSKIPLFQDGKFATIYLSPKDYHRVHMPVSGTLSDMSYIPGKLFSVNQRTCSMEDELFARNERMIAYFDTEYGPMAVIMVGAMIVAGINTVWGGSIAPCRQQGYTINYKNRERPVYLSKGEELGHFRLGSTVILLFPKDSINWGGSLAIDCPVRMGQLFGDIRQN